MQQEVRIHIGETSLILPEKNVNFEITKLNKIIYYYYQQWRVRFRKNKNSTTSFYFPFFVFRRTTVINGRILKTIIFLYRSISDRWSSRFRLKRWCGFYNLIRQPITFFNHCKSYNAVMLKSPTSASLIYYNCFLHIPAFQFLQDN